MRIKITLQIVADDGTLGTLGTLEEIISPISPVERAEDVGLSLAHGKALLADVQRRVVQHQLGAWATARRLCRDCGRCRRAKGSYPIVFRTLFGDIPVASPRLHRCACEDGSRPATFSPLTELLPDHVAPDGCTWKPGGPRSPPTARPPR